MEILEKKQYKQYNYVSRYSPFPVYYHTLDNKYLVATDKWLKNDTLYSEYIIQKGDTYDSLALKYYNNPTYYWIICSFNRISDPFELPEVGSKIKIPSFSNIDYEE